MKFTWVFLLKEFSFCFFDLYICYKQVLVQKRWHYILVKIVHRSDLGEFSYEIYPKFFFLIINNFPFVSSTPIYAIYRFSCKNSNIAFRSKFLIGGTTWTSLYFRTKFTWSFLFFVKNFPFVSLTST